MAVTPMQRKARNSFLLGMIITLLIAAVIVAFLMIQLNKTNEEITAMKARQKDTYIITADIKSGGEIIFGENVSIQKVDMASIPENVITTEDFDEIQFDTSEDGTNQKKYKVISKIDLKTGTVLTSDMIARDGEVTSDLRTQEYNMILIPTQLETGEYVDIRLRTPTGADYVVVSRKKITIPTISEVPSASSVLMNLNESEIEAMSSAIVEAYIMQGSILYATRYVDPGLQDSIIPTYVPNDAVINAMNQNPNIVQEAKNELITRYNSARDAVRGELNSSLDQYSEDRLDNIEQGVEEQITKAQEERERYLEALSGM